MYVNIYIYINNIISIFLKKKYCKKFVFLVDTTLGTVEKLFNSEGDQEPKTQGAP